MATLLTIEVTAPAGVSALLFKSMRTHEEMSRLSEYRLELLSTDGDVNLDDVLGKVMTVKVALPQDRVRYFGGYVTRMAYEGMRGRYHGYSATLHPWLWFLTRTADCRIFQDMTVPNIVKKVFGDYGTADFEFHLTGTYRTWDYCVQYRETDFNFVSRLLEHEGIYYYFKHQDGRSTLVVTDSYSGHEAFAGYEKLPYVSPGSAVRPELEHVQTWEVAREIQSGVFAHDDYDFTRPSVELLTTKSLIRDHAEANHKIYDYPGQYTQKADGEQYAGVRIDELASHFEIVRGSANARGVCVGFLLTLEDHPRSDQNREYLLLSTSYHLEYAGYESGGGTGAICECSFAAMSSHQNYRPARLTPKPSVQGPQTAVVVGTSGEEIYTDEYGRVKVHFHWDRVGKKDENSSCWLRVSHPWAGKGWGAIWIPRIGHEVIVDFLEGDPDQPIVTGRVYNADNTAPYKLKDKAAVSGIKSSTVKGSGYNEMSMDDTSGSEKITIHGQHDMATTVEHDQTNTVNNKFTETIKSDAAITVTDGNLTHKVQTGTADYTVAGALTETYNDAQKTTVAKDITIESSTGTITISADGKDVHVKANTTIKLEVGQSSIEMETGGKITIKGTQVEISGSESVQVSGGKVTSEATSGNNTVKGIQVMLNSD